MSSILSNSTINQCVINAKYAVRGLLPMLAGDIKAELAAGKKYPFTTLAECNIGSPHLFGQKPISFYREVLGCLLAPHSIDKMALSDDVKKRAKYYLKNISTSLGAYTPSLGYPFIRKNIAKYIKERDNIDSNPNHIFCSDGATPAITNILQMLINNPKTGIMIPIPQYPLYSGVISLHGGNAVGYYLDEDNGWTLNLKELEDRYEEAQKKGLEIKAIVSINPGNPTGGVFNRDTMEKLVEFCVAKRIVLLSDEVYQTNIYKEGKKFISAKSVLHDMKADIPLFSFHSASKGLLGECGIRGGYCEMVNVPNDILQQVEKLRSMQLGSNSTGQLLTNLMVDPPKRGECSDATCDQYDSEIKELYDSLKRRAKMFSEYLNKMPNYKCNEIDGAMYAFPKFTLPEKAIEASKKFKIEKYPNEKIEPDTFYCIKCTKNFFT